MNGKLSKEAFDSLDITGPYIDRDEQDALKKLNLEERFRVYTGDSHDEPAENPGEMPLLEKATWKAARKMLCYMKENGLRARDVSEQTGIAPALFSRVSKCIRGLSIAPGYIEPLCYKVMHMSCNEVFLGLPAEFTLTGLCNEIARGLVCLPEEKTQKLKEAAEQEYEKFMEASVQGNKSGHIRDIDEMIRDRFEILTDGTGRNRIELFGKETPTIIRQRLIRYLRPGSASTHLDFLMFLACELNGRIPLDYFVAEDMSDYVNFYFSNGSERIRIEDRNICVFFAKTFALPKANRSRLLAVAMAQIVPIM